MRHDVLDAVEHVVERVSQLDDVLAIDRRHEVDRRLREHLVVDLVAFVLEFMNGLDVIDEIARLFEILDCIDEKLGLLQGKLGQLLVGFEVVELVLLAMRRSPSPHRLATAFAKASAR